jgi:hypothetical protein
MTINIKNFSIYALITFLFFFISPPLQASPYTGADIELSGQSYSDLQMRSGNRDRWFDVGSDSIYSPWSSWAEYTVDLYAGNWNIGINVINHGNIAGGTGWYDNFLVRDEYNNILNITASDDEIYYDFFNYDIATSGQYTFRFTWFNDKWGGRYDPLHRDANIQINNVFFDDTATSPVPEPDTILLFGLGLLGLAGLNRKKQYRYPAIQR